MRRPVLLLIASPVFLAQACRQPGVPGPPPPHSEFLVATDDSTFWVTTGQAGVRARGTPIVLASYGGRFYELYAQDDDRSYPEALFVGQRVYRRDLVTGDSLLIFHDSIVPAAARAYARANPAARPLEPDEIGDDEPTTTATAQLDFLDLHGPFLSYEYAADRSSPNALPWHSLRRGVLDLRTGRPARLPDLVGETDAAQLWAAGRRALRMMEDSVIASRSRAGGERAVHALASVHFDESSFTIEAVDGSPAVAFATSSSGLGQDAGVSLSLPPIRASGAVWWTDVRSTLPDQSGDSLARWPRSTYVVIARYDTAATAHMSIADSARREWPIATVAAPVRRIFWLDGPAVDSTSRQALRRAFEEASQYDDAARTVSRWRPGRGRGAGADRGKGRSGGGAGTRGRRARSRRLRRA